MKHQVFISYRRDDSRWVVKNIYQYLIKVFSKDQIFMDVDGISYGADFKKEIQEQVNECDVLIAVIGKNWLQSVDKDGKRRIDDSNDFVRIEISTALKREIRVIPLLVDKASMPSSEELPEELSSLTWRNAIEISDINFDVDVKRLIKSLRKDTDNIQRGRKSILLVFTVLVLILGVWGSYKFINKKHLTETDEKRDWKIALSSNDSLDYINYIKKHENGEHKELAVHILDSIRLKNYALDSNGKTKVVAPPDTVSLEKAKKVPKIDNSNNQQNTVDDKASNKIFSNSQALGKYFLGAEKLTPAGWTFAGTATVVKNDDLSANIKGSFEIQATENITIKGTFRANNCVFSPDELSQVFDASGDMYKYNVEHPSDVQHFKITKIMISFTYGTIKIIDTSPYYEGFNGLHKWAK